MSSSKRCIKSKEIGSLCGKGKVRCPRGGEEWKNWLVQPRLFQRFFLLPSFHLTFEDSSCLRQTNDRVSCVNPVQTYRVGAKDESLSRTAYGNPEFCFYSTQFHGNGVGDSDDTRWVAASAYFDRLGTPCNFKSSLFLYCGKVQTADS